MNIFLGSKTPKTFCTLGLIFWLSFSSYARFHKKKKKAEAPKKSSPTPLWGHHLPVTALTLSAGGLDKTTCKIAFLCHLRFICGCNKAGHSIPNLSKIHTGHDLRLSSDQVSKGLSKDVLLYGPSPDRQPRSSTQSQGPWSYHACCTRLAPNWQRKSMMPNCPDIP